MTMDDPFYRVLLRTSSRFALLAEDEGEGSEAGAGGSPASGASSGEGAGGGDASPAAGGGEGGASPSGQDSPVGGSGGSASPSPASQGTQPSGESWKDRRISQLTAQLREEKARNAAAGKPAATMPAAGGEAAPDLDALVEQRATVKAAEQAFLDRCKGLEQEGKKAFGTEWDSRVSGLRQLVNPDSAAEVVAWNGLLIAAMETGEGVKILHELGGNLDEAQRVMSLPAVRMTVELTKMATKLAAAGEGEGAGEGTEVSGAARPIRPVGGRGPSHTAISPDDPARSDSLDIATWMARRNVQVKERGIR